MGKLKLNKEQQIKCKKGECTSLAYLRGDIEYKKKRVKE